MNRLDELASFTSPKVHSSGRRELRNQLLSRPITIHAKPRSEADKARAMMGELIDTDPIKRATPKVKGKKKLKRRAQ